MSRILYQTLGDEGERRFVVQWYTVPFHTASLSSADLTIQLVLHEGTGEVEYILGPMMPHATTDTARERASGSSATIGLQSWGRGRGVTISDDVPGVALSGSWFVLSPYVME